MLSVIAILRAVISEFATGSTKAVESTGRKRPRSGCVCTVDGFMVKQISGCPSNWLNKICLVFSLAQAGHKYYDMENRENVSYGTGLSKVRNALIIVQSLASSEVKTTRLVTMRFDSGYYACNN